MKTREGIYEEKPDSIRNGQRLHWHFPQKLCARIPDARACVEYYEFPAAGNLILKYPEDLDIE